MGRDEAGRTNQRGGSERKRGGGTWGVVRALPAARRPFPPAAAVVGRVCAAPCPRPPSRPPRRAPQVRRAVGTLPLPLFPLPSVPGLALTAPRAVGPRR